MSSRAMPSCGTPTSTAASITTNPRSRPPGLAIARMLGHITYLSPEAMGRKFDLNRHEPRDVQTEFEKRFSVGSYLAYQGDRFVERFDANSYITISLALDMFDLGVTSAGAARQLPPWHPAPGR